MRTELAEMPFDIAHQAVKHGASSHPALVITPKTAMVVGRKRISELRVPAGISRVERWLIEQARQGGPAARIVLFRGVNDAGERVWQFDPSLTQTELEEAGYVMCKALLPFHRRLMAGGVVLMVHTDWGLRECYAMRTGVQRVLDESGLSRGADPTREADRWVLRHMLLHAALDLDHVVKTLLPAHLTMVERRLTRVRELVAQLPARDID